MVWEEGLKAMRRMHVQSIHLPATLNGSVSKQETPSARLTTALGVEHFSGVQHQGFSVLQFSLGAIPLGRRYNIQLWTKGDWVSVVLWVAASLGICIFASSCP